MIGLLVNGKPKKVFHKPLVAWNNARGVLGKVELEVRGQRFLYKPYRFDNFMDWYNELCRS